MVDLTVLREDIKKALETEFPGELFVQMANTVRYSGTSYSTGMILAHGSTGGLPDFVELIQIAVVHGKVSFIVKCLNAWYIEHFRSYCMSLKTQEVLKLLSQVSCQTSSQWQHTQLQESIW